MLPRVQAPANIHHANFARFDNDGAINFMAQAAS
ncbi:hypothetical protein X759_35170 [Mesorhizobium sp. LSHC420B00]|nr:hypothetical protein X759_35170 [Mesorhizobium sp. LSHC420B00]